MTILITGSAGFIGANLTLRLLQTEMPIDIIGFDNVNSYYDVGLKEYRLRQTDEEAKRHPENNYTFVRGNLADRELIEQLFSQYRFDVVVNLAAQA